jgi:predicted DNA-binding protein (MmcQ/YjbR family)
MTRQELIALCLTFPATYEDYPFDNMSDPGSCTVMRHSGNKKSFALIMPHKGELYLNLKCDPFEADFIRQAYKSVIPAYHMNKTHWNTVVMGGDVPEDEIHRMIANSYDLIKPKARKQRKPI